MRHDTLYTSTKTPVPLPKVSEGPLSTCLFHSCCEAECKAWPAPLLLAPAMPACAAAGTASLGVASAAPDDAFGASVLTRLKGLHDMYTGRWCQYLIFMLLHSRHLLAIRRQCLCSNSH